MSQKVIILGGGVAGMSAAHELIERGFEVDVFEKQPSIPGGKARSVPVPGSARDGRRPLPAEHGFRFFPGFYRHVTDTMKRIPFPGNRRGVLDNLVPSTKLMMARKGGAPIVAMTRFPRSLAEFRVDLHAMTGSHLGLTKDDIDTFAEKIWQLMTSSRERRLEEYEKIGWWHFLDADAHSPAYQVYFATGLTRTLVAAKARQASTKTGGDIFIQLLFNMADPEIETDRVLNGPTNDVWINPWLTYLREHGVRYHFGQSVRSIVCSGGRIDHVVVADAQGQEHTVQGDYYVSALPVEVLAKQIDEDLLRLDPTLGNLKTLADDVAWMNGLQFYLRRKVDINRGHVMYIDSPWALTSISQPQFWRHFNPADFGDGAVQDILSIDISDWCTPGSNGLRARDCRTKEAIKDEVWNQLKQSLNVDGQEVLRDEDIVTWHLDGDIAPEREGSGGEGCDGEAAFDPGAHWHDLEPLLVNKVNTWSLRPEAYTRIPNFFLAGDYVRTYTDLATMEGANESARRAVNGIISASGLSVPLCDVWPLHEPIELAPLRWLDRRRYRKGLPWKDEFPLLLRMMRNLARLAARLRRGG